MLIIIISITIINEPKVATIDLVLVNGGWSSWSPWSQCTASCGGGTKVRLRHCDNPKPVNNGTNCTELSGSSVETAACNIYPCTDGELEIHIRLY